MFVFLPEKISEKGGTFAEVRIRLSSFDVFTHTYLSGHRGP